ncbi:MAG: UDP-3-O-(3-hydroxymyristoyl)glucosamine N-acyltransferase [Acidobacteriota bacterium]|nr:UDP-3-O-(3-hydroxymyristoyl)glucosamine N-acyltransferase [Acidobacteriota bacterium]
MTVREIAALVNAEMSGSGEREIRRVAGFADAGRDAVVFAQDDAALEAALGSSAGAILAPASAEVLDERVLRVKDAKYAFALCGKALAKTLEGPMVHPAASVDTTARLGAGTCVGAGAVIEADVVVGEDCTIGSRVAICRGVVLGDGVVVQPGAVLGSTGFGYATNAETGEHLLFPQQGALVIENNVEIGANTTIDRGALGETRIERGTKIDNQVHIGHNCVIGKNVLIAAQVGISGSCVIGDGAVLAGQVGLGDHVVIGPGVILGGSSGVFPHKRVEGPGEMFMGVPAEPLKDYLRTLAKRRKDRVKSEE